MGQSDNCGLQSNDSQVFLAPGSFAGTNSLQVLLLVVHTSLILTHQPG